MRRVNDLRAILAWEASLRQACIHRKSTNSFSGPDCAQHEVSLLYFCVRYQIRGSYEAPFQLVALPFTCHPFFIYEYVYM
jgi:hypothetical protein